MNAKLMCSFMEMYGIYPVLSCIELFFCGFVVLAAKAKYFVFQHNLLQISKILTYFLKNDNFCIVLIQFC